MNRFLVRVTLWMLVILGTASIIFSVIDQLKSFNPVIQGLETDCTRKIQPCWYGVKLGETETDEVKAIFGQLGDSITDNTAKGQLEIVNTQWGHCFAQFIYGRGESRVINEIILTNCKGVRLGDLLAHYGEPETLGTTITCDTTHAIIQHDHYFIEYPADGVIAAINRPAVLGSWLSLEGEVRQLYLVKPRHTDGRKTWVGIISFPRFARLHPEQVRTNSCGP